jgi:hypothetical protein
MKMYKNGQPIIIPEGTWTRLSAKQKAEFTATPDGGEVTSEMVIETIKTTGTPVIDKKKQEVAVVAEKIEDDITGNLTDKTIGTVPEIKLKPIEEINEVELLELKSKLDKILSVDINESVSERLESTIPELKKPTDDITGNIAAIPEMKPIEPKPVNKGGRPKRK